MLGIFLVTVSTLPDKTDGCFKYLTGKTTPSPLKKARSQRFTLTTLALCLQLILTQLLFEYLDSAQNLHLDLKREEHKSLFNLVF